MCSAEQPTIQSQGLLAGDRHDFPVDPHSGSPPREEWGCPQLPVSLDFPGTGTNHYRGRHREIDFSADICGLRKDQANAVTSSRLFKTSNGVSETLLTFLMKGQREPQGKPSILGQHTEQLWIQT